MRVQYVMHRTRQLEEERVGEAMDIQLKLRQLEREGEQEYELCMHVYMCMCVIRVRSQKVQVYLMEHFKDNGEVLITLVQFLLDVNR